VTGTALDPVKCSAVSITVTARICIVPLAAEKAALKYSIKYKVNIRVKFIK